MLRLPKVRRKTRHGGSREVTLNRLLAAPWFLLGKFYDAALRDFEEAARWYFKAAEAGCARAQYNLGELYVSGLGVLRDYAEAMRWLLMAAEKGNAAAQARLGAMYYKGQGVARDYVSAHQWVSISGENGNAKARRAVLALDEMMTPDQREEAVRRAEAWLDEHGRKWWAMKEWRE